MKKSLTLLAAALVLLTSAFAAEKEKAQTDNTKIVKNLLNNLKSDNKGVIESSAFMLGDLKSDEAVIPLQALLHDSPEASTRIVAALSLTKIGTARAIFAVTQAVRYDESPRVRVVCAWFANQVLKPEPFAFKFEDTESINITQRETSQR